MRVFQARAGGDQQRTVVLKWRNERGTAKLYLLSIGQNSYSV